MLTLIKFWLHMRIKIITFLIACACLPSCVTKEVLVECTQCQNKVVVNLSDYGIVNDGSVDCSSIINQIISDLPSGGGIIQFPSGVFRIESPITVSRNYVVLSGSYSIAEDGTKILESTIKASESNRAIHIPIIPDVNGRKNRISGVEISSLIIEGAAVGVLVEQDNDRIRIVDTFIKDCETGFYVKAADACVISGCSVIDADNALCFYGGIQNSIMDCTFSTRNNGVPCKLERETNLIFSGNKCLTGASPVLSVTGCQKINISKNRFEGRQYGLFDISGSYNTIMNNQIDLLSSIDSQMGPYDVNYGAVAIQGDYNNFTQNTISCQWNSELDSPVTISVQKGYRNRICNCTIADQNSDKVCYVTQSTEVLSSVEDVSKIYYIPQ